MMVTTPPDKPEDKSGRSDHEKPEDESGRSDQYLLTLRSLVLLLVCGVVVLLWMHDPRLGAAVTGGITVLAILAKVVK